MNEILEQTIESAQTRWGFVRKGAAVSIVAYATDNDGELIDDCEGSIYAGVRAAIKETDDATLEVVVRAIRATAITGVEFGAKRVALEMIRDLATSLEEEDAVPF